MAGLEGQQHLTVAAPWTSFVSLIHSPLPCLAPQISLIPATPGFKPICPEFLSSNLLAQPPGGQVEGVLCSSPVWPGFIVQDAEHNLTLYPLRQVIVGFRGWAKKLASF